MSNKILKSIILFLFALLFISSFSYAGGPSEVPPPAVPGGVPGMYYDSVNEVVRPKVSGAGIHAGSGTPNSNCVLGSTGFCVDSNGSVNGSGMSFGKTKTVISLLQLSAALADSGVSQIVVAGTITLTSALELTKPVLVDYGGLFVTGGNVLTVSDDFVAENYKVFDTSGNEVIFSKIATIKASWFGAERPIWIATNGAYVQTNIDTTGATFYDPVYLQNNSTMGLTIPSGKTGLIVGRVMTVGANARILVDIVKP